MAKGTVDPIVTFGFVMRVLRAAGVDFPTAWRCALPPALPDVERNAVRVALGETRSAWARAWDHEPATPGELRAAALVGALDDEPAGAIETSAIVVG